MKDDSEDLEDLFKEDPQSKNAPDPAPAVAEMQVAVQPASVADDIDFSDEETTDTATEPKSGDVAESATAEPEAAAAEPALELAAEPALELAAEPSETETDAETPEVADDEPAAELATEATTDDDTAIAPPEAMPEAPAASSALPQPKSLGAESLSPRSAADVPRADGMRLWTDNTGKFQVRARLVQVSDGMVRLQKETGRFTTVPFRRLSEADLAFVRLRAPALASAFGR
ncbi:MAG TPA: SHD1 domain-containing protein [Pirellulales bacterium]|nr:SHD1 domain-containing protein [Pirellulales bacterium]